MKKNNIETIHDYIAQFPIEMQEKLEQIRIAIREIIPGAEETIRYGIPTFRLHNRNAVHFGSFPHHTGFYPTPETIEAFKEKLASYKTTKGTIQFPLNQELPIELIQKMTEHRVKNMLK